ncbi:Secreted effector protein SseJ [Smittium mucronatum]|uniref:Secreted effector protein SseJ n=1 Tax=Smittium mucronatum TaxID=133383 RepID=A0A1R0GQ70_9FUNG|nr:Secreted effector protein SseJ [Smittium mucronatum]
MSPSAKNDNFLVVFGDSYSSVGNRMGQPKFLANWNTRFSNGPVWNEYLAHDEGFTLINFEVGGSATNSSFIESQTGFNNPFTDLLSQVAMYRNTFSGKLSASSLQNDVAVIETGSNDIFFTYEKVFSGSVDLEKYSDETVSSIISALESLIEFGYKKLVVFDTPFLSIMPVFGHLDEKAINDLDSYVQMTNKKLVTATASLEARYSDKINYIRTVSLYNIYKTMSTMDLKRSLNIIGLYDKSMPMGDDIIYSERDDSDNYMFIDVAHPSTRVHALLSSVFLETLADGNININRNILERLSNEFDLTKVSSQNNYLYNSTSIETGDIIVEEYTMETTKLNIESLLARKNSMVPGSGRK